MTPPTKPGFRRVLPILVVDGIFAIAIVAAILTGRAHDPVLGDFTLLHVLGALFVLASGATMFVTMVLPARRAKQAANDTVWERDR